MGRVAQKLSDHAALTSLGRAEPKSLDRERRRQELKDRAQQQAQTDALQGRLRGEPAQLWEQRASDRRPTASSIPAPSNQRWRARE
jgi:hypothetical protein